MWEDEIGFRSCCHTRTFSSPSTFCIESRCVVTRSTFLPVVPASPLSRVVWVVCSCGFATTVVLLLCALYFQTNVSGSFFVSGQYIRGIIYHMSLLLSFVIISVRNIRHRAAKNLRLAMFVRNTHIHTYRTRLRYRQQQCFALALDSSGQLDFLSAFLILLEWTMVLSATV